MVPHYCSDGHRTLKCVINISAKRPSDQMILQYDYMQKYQYIYSHSYNKCALPIAIELHHHHKSSSLFLRYLILLQRPLLVELGDMAAANPFFNIFIIKKW